MMAAIPTSSQSEKRKRIQAMEERPKISSFRGPQKSNKVDLESQNAGMGQQRKKGGHVQAEARLKTFTLNVTSSHNIFPLNLGE